MSENDEPQIDTRIANETIDDDRINDTTVRGVAFDACQFRPGAKRQVRFDGVTFNNCQFEDARFHDTIFNNCKFFGGQMATCGFTNNQFQQCIFTDTKIVGCSIDDGLVRDVQLRECKIEYLVVAEADVQKLAFMNCRVAQSGFDGGHYNQLGFFGGHNDGNTVSHTKVNTLAFDKCEQLLNLNLLESQCSRVFVQDCPEVVALNSYRCAINDLTIKRCHLSYVEFTESTLSENNSLSESEFVGLSFRDSSVESLLIDAVKIGDFLVLEGARFRNLRLNNTSYVAPLEILSDKVSYTDSDQFGR